MDYSKEKQWFKGDIIGSQIRTRPASMGMGFDSIFNDLMDFSPMKEIKFAVVSTKTCRNRCSWTKYRSRIT